MIAKILRIIDENRLENFGTLDTSNAIPHVGEFINILSNRFRVTQLEWFPLQNEVFIYIEDMLIKKE